MNRLWMPAMRTLRNGSVVLGVGLILLLTLIFTTTQSSYNVYLLCSCLLAAMGAIALNLMMGTAGQVSIGNAAFMAVGAFSCVILTKYGIPFPADVIIGALIAGAIGLVFGLPALRLRGLYLALSTLAAHFVILYFANDYQKNAPGGGSVGFILKPQFKSGGLAHQTDIWAWLLAGVLVVIVLVVRGTTRTKSGRTWRLIRDHEEIAGTLGLGVTRYKLYAFVIGSVIIGLQGGLLAHFSGNVSADSFTFLLAVQFIAMVLIGGLDSITGAIIGAVIVTLLPKLAPTVLTGIIGADHAALSGAQYSQIVYGVLVVAFVTLAPGGIVTWFRKLGAYAARRLDGGRSGPALAPAGVGGGPAEEFEANTATPSLPPARSASSKE